MSEATNTPLSNRADILSELWIKYKGSEGFEDFITYNDLGLPLAYAVSHGIIESNTMVDGFINETFDVFVEALEIEDIGYDDLTSMFEDSGRSME